VNTTIDTEISKLKRLNLIAGALHLASLLAILFLANDAKLPVNAIYLTEAPGTGNFSDPINLFNLKIGYMVAAFLALSAFFHFLIISPAMFGKYTAGLKNHINVFRWVEYSLSSTIMIIVILQLNGTADYIALMGIAGVNVCMILFGWLQEKYTTPGDGDLLPFWFFVRMASGEIHDTGRRRSFAVLVWLHRRHRALAGNTGQHSFAKRASRVNHARFRLRHCDLVVSLVQLLCNRAI